MIPQPKGGPVAQIKGIRRIFIFKEIKQYANIYEVAPKLTCNVQIKITIMRNSEPQIICEGAFETNEIRNNLLIDAYSITNNVQRTIFEGTRASHHLTLALSFQINNTEIYNRTQIHKALQHLNI
jgi:hypothetical protein